MQFTLMKMNWHQVAIDVTVNDSLINIEMNTSVQVAMDIIINGWLKLKWIDQSGN